MRKGGRGGGGVTGGSAEPPGSEVEVSEPGHGGHLRLSLPSTHCPFCWALPPCLSSHVVHRPPGPGLASENQYQGLGWNLDGCRGRLFSPRPLSWCSIGLAPLGAQHR